MAGTSLQAPSRKPTQPQVPSAVEKLCQVDQPYRSTDIDKSLVAAAVSELNSKDHSACSHLDSKTSSTIIKVLLECHDCHHSERGIYLLGAALFHDSHSPSKKRSVKKKKEAIGTECLHLVLEFFVDGTKSDSMRQWAGILAIQLFQDCDANIQKLELGPEQQRRGLGTVVLEDENEIIRIICGHLITSLLSAGVLLEHLWPVNTDKRLYANFPNASHGSRGWNQKFQDYLDDVWQMMEPTETLGQMYFTQNVSLEPEHNFGPEDHNIVVIIEPTSLIIWTGMVLDTEDFYHCIAIPLATIHRMLIKRMENSQLSDLLTVHLFLENRGLCCSLDGDGTVILTKICMVLKSSVAEDMRDDFRIICPHVEVIDESSNISQELGDENYPVETRQMSLQSSGSIDVVHCSSNRISVVRPRPMASPPNKQLDEMSEMATKERVWQDDIPDAALELDGSPKLTGEQVEHDKLSNEMVPNASPEIEMVKNSVQVFAPEKPTMAERKRVSAPKPKAKAPLRQTQRPRRNTQRQSPAMNVASPGGELISNELSYEKIEDHILKLSKQFPSTDPSTLRAAVLASKGDYEATAKLLSKSDIGQNRDLKVATNAQNENGELDKPTTLGKASGPSTTYPTPAVKKDSAISNTEPRNQQLKTDLLLVPKGEQKKYSLKRALKDQDDKDCFEIPSEADGEEPPAKGKNRPKTAVKSTQPAPATRKAVAKSATTKKAKLTKAGQQKRRSAPAALGSIMAPRRGQRLAAAAASKNLKEAGESDELEEAKEAPVREKPKPTQKSKRSSAANIQLPEETTADPSDNKIAMQKQEDMLSLGMEQDDFSAQLSDDLYGASPKKPVRRPAHKGDHQKQPQDDLESATLTNRTAKVTTVPVQEALLLECPPKPKVNALGKMAAKMGSLLGSLDEQHGLEDLATEHEEQQVKNGVKTSSDVSPDKVLVDDYLCRKTPVVGFNNKGARNQGVVGTVASSVPHPKTVVPVPSTPVREDTTEDHKRKREGLDDVENCNTLRKRQSMSPDPNKTPMQGDNDYYFGTSPPAANQMEISVPKSSFRGRDTVRKLQRDSKPNSQGPRVDQNGSPLAPRSSQIDRIGNVRRKFLDEQASEMHTPKSIGPQPVIKSPDIFGPKLRLGSIPKARPGSSLEETALRYIPHKKNLNGLYEGLNTNEIIAPEKALVDPFTGKDAPHHSSEFSDRLLAGSSKANERSKQQPWDDMHRRAERANMNTKGVPTHTNKNGGLKSMVAGRRGSKRVSGLFLDDNDQTLVNPESQTPSNSSPPDMTTDTTYEPRSPLTEKAGRVWNTAVRPHYTSLSETIHHIADEVIIRLANEEDGVRLIAKQYKENGDKIIHQLEKKRNGEKASMTRKMEQSKSEMVALYTEAKGLADRTKQTMEETPLSRVEKQWKKDSEALQKRIDHGRAASGG